MSVLPQFSPDGHSWWDGGAWRHVSADGRRWWDGVSWMPMPNDPEPFSRPVEAVEEPGGLRRVRLRGAAHCVLCGRNLARGEEALFHGRARSLRCMGCPPGDIDFGQPGRSAAAEAAGLRLTYEARVLQVLGRYLGRVFLWLTGAPEEVGRGLRGALGERKLANALARIPGAVALYDRAVPGMEANIDAILVAPAGVFVIDAKRYRGRIRVRGWGGLREPRRERLYVGRRDCSGMASAMAWQAHAVIACLRAAGDDFLGVAVAPVLCFVDGDWGWWGRPTAYGGVWLTKPQTIGHLAGTPRTLEQDEIWRVARCLAAALPAK